MQIQNNNFVTANIPDNLSQPNVGDVLQVVMKERVNNQDAIVFMKGTTSNVTFEGKVPEQDKVLVEITGKTPEGNYTVKVSDRSVATPSSQQTIPQNTDSQVSEAIKSFTSRGMTVTKENISAVKEFLTNGNGTAEQKMDTLRMMAQKQIAITDITLKSVHEALNGKPLSQSLLSVLDEFGIEYQPSRFTSTTSAKSLTTVRSEVQREPDLAKVIKIVEDFLKNTNLNEMSKKTVGNSVSEAKRLSQVGQAVNAKIQLIQNLVAVEKLNATSNINTSGLQANNETSTSPMEVVQNIIDKVEREPNIARAVDQVKEAVKTASLPPKVVEQLEKAIQNTTKLQQAGQSVQARVQLTTALNQIEQQAQVEEVKPSEVIRQVKEKVAQEPNVTQAIEQTKEAIKILGLPQQAVEKLQQAVQEATKLKDIGRVAQARIQLIGHMNQLIQSLVTEETTVTSANTMKAEPQASSIVSMNATNENNFEASIRNLVKEVQKEPLLAKVLDKTAAVLAEHSTNEEIKELKKAHDKAQQLQEQGRELAARREISSALSKMEQYTTSQQPNTNESALSQAEQYAINEVIQTVKMDSQNVMVTEISKKLSQMAIDFKKLKQEVAKNLDNVSKMLENRNVLPQTNVKQILESTIHKLDNVILKGDFLLYTDMSTEKKLLSASSQLAEAKKLLAKGKIVEANKLVKEVKANIENIIFKPSDVKVKHFVSNQLGLDNFSSTRQIANTLEQAVQPLSSQESSSRQMYEALRKLGLTHENEAGISLVSKQGASIDQQQNENVKAALLKMIQNEDAKPQLMQQVEQAVNSITGQQLLNKQDSSGLQNLFFQIPYLIENKVENIKIYVNSRKDGDKVDWENCSVYFVLETKKLGDVGVLLSSSDKNVSLTFRSDKAHLSDRVSGLTEITQERFKEIGYNLGTMGVKPLQERQEPISKMEEEKNEVSLTPTFTEKGYDFSI